MFQATAYSPPNDLIIGGLKQLIFIAAPLSGLRAPRARHPPSSLSD